MQYVANEPLRRGATLSRWARSTTLALLALAVGGCNSDDQTSSADPSTSFALSYDGNGANGLPPASVMVDIGAAVNAAAPATLALPDNTFGSWNLEPGGGGTTYDVGDTLTMGTANVTLYAQWIPGTYSVTYDGNGNDGGSAPVDPTAYAEGDTVTALTHGTLTRTGLVFDTWNTQIGGGGTDFDPASTFTMPATGVTLYAQWVPPTYAVTYNGNGSDGGAAPVDGTAYSSGDTVTTLAQGTLTRTGFAFNNWNTEAGGGGTDYSPAATFTMPAAGVTLYAQWTATYAVTYDGNGSDGGSVPVDATAYTAGATVTALAEGTLTRGGFAFDTWNTEAGGGGTDYAPAATFAMPAAGVTLYAQWTATYAVTYDGNGNDGGSAPTDATAYAAGDTVTVLSVGSLTRTNFTFDTWNTAAGGGGTDYAPAATFSMPAAGVTLYAQWTPTTFTVTYDGNGSDGGTVPVDGTGYSPGDTATVLTEGSLTQAGFTFGIWNTQAGGGGTDYAPAATFTMPGANVTLYAQWDAPGSVTATPGDAQVFLSWSSVSGATEYKVYYNTVDDQGTATVWNETVGLITSTSSTVHGLTNMTAYYFWVGAVDMGGETLVTPGSVTATPLASIFSPEVSSIEPGENAREVALDKQVVVNFNQALDPLTVDTVTVTASDGSPVAVTVAVGAGNTSIEIDPQSGTWSEATRQTITLTTGIQSAGGDPLAAPFSFSFETLNNADLIARWVFNNSGTDVSGNTLDASITNGVFDPVSLHEGSHSLAFSGSSIVDIGAVDLGNQFTYTAWVNVTSASSILTLFANGSAGFSRDGIKVFVNEWGTTNRKIVIESGNGSSGLQLLTDANFVTFGDWFHVAVAIDRTAGECYFYFNGAQATTYDSSSGLPSTAIRDDFNNNANLYLNQFVGGSFKYMGSQDDVRFYNSVLTPAEIANIANEN